MLHFSKPLLATAGSLVKAAQKGAVVTLTLNRPESLNALNGALAKELMVNISKYDADPSCSVMVITGEGRAFVGGADIKQMKDRKFQEYIGDYDFAPLYGLKTVNKPLIAAVNGFCLGGGCELAMCCDIIIASETAKFGQPEIKLGIIPGLGGTQRLPRAIGKAKAMEWVLTGNLYTAAEAERAGLVSRVVKHEELMSTAMSIAETIAGYSQVTTKMAKAAVNASQETTLSAGLETERISFITTFATSDRTEGMTAFVEKRPPVFKNE